MRKHILLIGLSLSLGIAPVVFISCSGGNSATAEVVNGVSEKTVSENTVPENTVSVNEENSLGNDVLENNETPLNEVISLNGVMIAPPKNRSAVTLTIGGSLQGVYVFTGDYVKKGQVIATLKNPEFIQLQENYITALAQVEYLEKEYQRQEKLASHEAASQKKLQQSKAEYLSEKGRLDAARAQLELLDVDTEKLLSDGIKTYMDIKAPISGYVTNMKANLGQYFEVGQPICDVANKSGNMLLLTAYEKDLVHLTVGNKIEFVVNGIADKIFTAEVSAIEQMVDEESRSINVYAHVNETDNLFRHGMYVSAKVKRNM